MSSERMIRIGRRPYLAIALLFAAGLATGRAAPGDGEPPPIPPPDAVPPPDIIEPPPENRHSPGGANHLEVKSEILRCQRCGYAVNSGWRYCPACGWNHMTLAGDAAGERLERIQSSTMGVVVIKDKLGFEDFLSPEQLEIFLRYRVSTGTGGQRKHFGSALPYGVDGLYVTSARILHKARNAQLRTFRNHFVDAEILGIDIFSGIGLLRAELSSPEPLKPSIMQPDVGERMWVVCLPVAADDDLVRYLPASIHSGRLLDRGFFGTKLVSHENLLRTDHTLPSGCVGSLLIDSLGTSAGMVLGSPDDGIVYAQPLSGVVPIIESLARGESIERPFYGLGLVMPDDLHRARFDLPADVSLPIVAFLIEGSPARLAGVEPGDVVTAIDGEEIGNVVQAGSLLLGRQPNGNDVRLSLRRRGDPIELKVRPGKRVEPILLEPVDEIQEALQANLIEVKTGKSSLHGLRIERLVRGGRGEEAGYREGDVIRRVEGDPMRELETFNKIVRRENSDMFDAEARGDESTVRATYLIGLEIRTADGEKRNRPHWNLFPEVLAPPIY